MLSTSSRLLRLAALLTTRPWWAAEALAQRLEVTPRTVRRDIQRLRELDYPVESVPGPGGGYRLGSGSGLPPLQLDAEEAVAVAVCLRLAAANSVGGVQDAAPRALAKLERMLPPRVRKRVAAIEAATVPLGDPTELVDPDVLLQVAEACRASERLRFQYVSRDDVRSRRYVEPLRIVQVARRWYLAAFDLDRDDWRTFRLDRISRPYTTAERFTFDEEPDAAELVAAALSGTPYRFLAVVRVLAPLDEVAARVPPWVATLEADGDATRLTAGANHLDGLAAHLASIGFDLEVLDPPELRDELAAMAERLARAGSRSPTG
jgi:predicted DNA-binding transcriptional regulator YafY